MVIPEGAPNGTLFTQGGRFAGYGLYVKDNKPTYHYNLAGVERFTVNSNTPIPSGEVTLKMVYESDADKPFAGADVTLFVNDNEIGKGREKKASPTALP